MRDEDKTREQLLEELLTLRTNLSRVDDQRRQAEEEVLRASEVAHRTTIAAALRDIGERKRVEEKLRRSEALLLETEHLAHLGSWEVQIPSKAVTASKELFRIFGLDPEESAVPFETFMDRAHPEDRNRITECNDRALQDHSPIEYSYRIILPDGAERIIRAWGRVETDETGQVVRLMGSCQDVTERKQAEEKLREYCEHVQALSRRLLTVQEEEHRHLARELHDEIGQILTSLKFALEAAAAHPEAAGGELARARPLIGEAMARVRELSFDLRPALLDHLGLLPALRGLMERYGPSTGLCVNFKWTDLDRRFAPELETAVYRIVQEALTNVARHAGVSEATARVWVDGDTLEIQVEDQGVGFDSDAALVGDRSSGLPGMLERAMLLGGRLIVASTPGSGTHLLAQLPLTGLPGEKIHEHFHRLGR